MDVARVHVRSWQVGYRGILPDAYLDGMRPEERAARYTFGDPDPGKPDTIVAVDDGAIRGFVTTGPARDETGGAGHLMALYVDPDAWGRGIGRILIARGRDAADVAINTTFGPNTLSSFSVRTDEVAPS